MFLSPTQHARAIGVLLGTAAGDGDLLKHLQFPAFADSIWLL